MARLLPADQQARSRLLQDARRLALELMTFHGLHGWSFRFNRRKRHLGVCFHAHRTIELSVYAVLLNPPDAVRDTILHEIAHALVGAEHGHGPVWKAKCLEIGAKPERLCHDAVMPAGRWTATCGACRRVFTRHRRPARLSGWHCRACGPQHGALRWQSR
jgi:predicted SprT family Zn-dependent metalloprotease